MYIDQMIKLRQFLLERFVTLSSKSLRNYANLTRRQIHFPPSLFARKDSKRPFDKYVTLFDKMIILFQFLQDTDSINNTK